MSFAPRFTVTNAIAAALTRIERALVQEAHHTNRLQYVAGKALV